MNDQETRRVAELNWHRGSTDPPGTTSGMVLPDIGGRDSPNFGGIKNPDFAQQGSRIEDWFPAETENIQREQEEFGNHPPGEEPPRRRRRTPDAEEKERQKAREREETSDMWWRFVVKLLLVAAILVAVFRFALGIQIQHGNRMYPYLMDGDLVITFKLEAYREGDVVAYRRPDTGQIALSRIAAKGPCEIRVADGHLLVNGNPQEDSVFYDTSPLTEYGISYPLQLGANGYFLLDDNRPIASDSRAYGEVSQWELMGKVIYVFRRRGI